MSTNPISEELLAEMLAGLEGVTPGPWYTTGAPWFSGNDGVLAGSPDGNIAYLIADCDDGMNPRNEYVEGHGPFPLGDKNADAAHIARCDPDTIRAILTELRDRRAADSRANQAVVTEIALPIARRAFLERLDIEGHNYTAGDGSLFYCDEWFNLNRALAAALTALSRAEGQDDADEAYEIGKSDGYVSAIQDLDRATGGDGEFRVVLGSGDDERHCPDEITMKARILARFARAEGQELVTVSYAETVAPYAAAIRMVREAVGELFGPMADLESEDAVLLRGPEPHHDAEALIAALQRTSPALVKAPAPATSFQMLMAAYVRGNAWAHENGLNADGLEKAAYDYADKMTAAPSQPQAKGKSE